MVVEAMITGHNAGGLECEVNHIRGLHPHQPDRLVSRGEHSRNSWARSSVASSRKPTRAVVISSLSRRAFLEREREEARKEMLASI